MEMFIVENDKFGKIRVVMRNDKPWYVVSDVLVALGYNYKPHFLLKRYCENMAVLSGSEATELFGSRRKIAVFPHEDMEAIVGRSSRDRAGEFLNWINCVAQNEFKKQEDKTSNLLAFENATLGSVRVIMRGEEPWFVAKDVCDCLGLDLSSGARNLDEDEKGLHTMQTPGGNQQMQIVSEAGLYLLIFRSRKPEAKTFKRWVTHEILPTLRKTGSYSVRSGQSEQKRNIKMPSATQMKGLNDVLMNICKLATSGDTVSAEALDCFYKDNFGISILGYVRDAQERVKKKEEEERRARRARAMEEEDTSGIKSMFEF